MLRPKKSLIKPLTILFLIFSCACIALPEKPDVELCILDVQNREASCGTTNGSEFKSADEATYNRLWGMLMRSSAVRQPIEYIDHGVCLRPSQWGVLQKYTHSLEIFIQTRCK